MKYVKKDGVVKEVSDHIAGAYISAGWVVTTQEEFLQTSSEQPQPRRSPIADRG